MGNIEFSQREMKNGEGCIVTFTETLDINLVEEFSKYINSQIEAGIKYFVFDFRNTKIVQSPAVAVILHTAEIIVSEKNRLLCTCNMSSMNEKIFEMVGLFMYADYCKNEDMAINSSVW